MPPKRSWSYDASAPFSVTVFVHLVAVAIITLVLVWLLHFRDGLAFKSPKIFNVHPLLMIIGFILVSGQAIMTYKTVGTTRKRQKQIHVVLQGIALVGGIVGVYAVFKFHADMGIPHLYTLHSWFGITTITLFAIQWLVSFLSFVYPGAQLSTRARLAPWHAVMGAIIFLMAILTAEIGLAEKFTFIGLHRSQEALIVNFTGLLIFLFAVSVGLILVLPTT